MVMKKLISQQALIVAAMALTCLAGDPFAIPWYTIDGGGAMRSDSDDGRFKLSGTIGQPDAGVMTAKSIKLTGGFWFQIPTGDCDENNVADFFDHQALVECLTGPAADRAAECECQDLEASDSVDLRDYAVFQRSFSNPQIP
jgi:hypothetical protein